MHRWTGRMAMMIERRWIRWFRQLAGGLTSVSRIEVWAVHYDPFSITRRLFQVTSVEFQSEICRFMDIIVSSGFQDVGWRKRRKRLLLTCLLLAQLRRASPAVIARTPVANPMVKTNYVTPRILLYLYNSGTSERNLPTGLVTWDLGQRGYQVQAPFKFWLGLYIQMSLVRSSLVLRSPSLCLQNKKAA